MAEKVPGWLERILLPQLGELRGEFKAINRRIDGLEGKFDGRFAALEGKIQGLEETMDGQFSAVHSEIRGLDGKMDALDKRVAVSERLAVVEGKIRELEARN